MKTFLETTGCTADGFTVDGKDLDDLNAEEILELFDYLTAKFRERVRVRPNMVRDLVACFPCDDSGHGPTCDQCGDAVCTTTWNI